MTKPAVCEINKCGVIAIGRCDQCGKAFCNSHRGQNYAGTSFFTNICISCTDAKLASEARQDQASYENKQKVLNRIHKILDALITVSNVGQIPQYERKNKKRLWWHVEDYVGTHKVWPIGNLIWYQGETSFSPSVYNNTPSGITSEKEIIKITLPKDYQFAEQHSHEIHPYNYSGKHVTSSKLEDLTEEWIEQVQKHLEEIVKRHKVKV